MAAGKREVKVLITGDASKLTQELGKVQSKIGGMSTGMKTALDGISFAKVGRGLMSIAQGFTDAALEVDKFSGATGVAVEDASRMLEAFGDLGIDAAKVQSAIGKFNKTLGKSQEAFDKYGVEIVRTDDGIVDVNKSFLNAIRTLEKIEDPTLRAAAGTELFGRSWTELAPIIGIADDLESQLTSVGEAQIFDEEEIEKARRMRDSMAELDDSVGTLKNSLAIALLPVISSLSTSLATVDPQMLTFAVGILGVVVVVGKLGTAIGGVSSLLSIFAAHPVFTATLLVVAGLALIIANWDAISAAIGRAIAQVDAFMAKATGPFASIYGKINNALGGDFGKGQDILTDEAKRLTGKKANGGPVRSGGMYLVGERGPELFTSRSSGEIIPNHAIGGSTTINVYPSPGMSEEDLARKVKRAQDRAAKGLGLAA